MYEEESKTKKFVLFVFTRTFVRARAADTPGSVEEV
jgi:hypothetical protein